MPRSIRLDHFFSSQGLVSRRKVGEYLKENRVTINGQKVLKPGERFDVSKDTLLINGQPPPTSNFTYLILNKPIGYVSSTVSQAGEKTVLELINPKERLYPVGRLDKDSQGLLLLTNDGELTHKLTHPKFHLPKTYLLKVSGPLTPKALSLLSTGVSLKSGRTAPAEVKLISSENKIHTLKITLHEGRNRQLRRMASALNLDVISLTRLAFGPLDLQDLALRAWRALTSEEVIKLKSLS